MAPTMRIRDLGYTPGTTSAGPTNSVLDVPGLAISQLTLPTRQDASDIAKKYGDGSKPSAVKGVTILLPRGKDKAHIPCHAGTHIYNGNGELTGLPQIADWGFTNMPIIFTNSFSLGACYEAGHDFMLDHQEKRGADALTIARNYGTPVVGETCDWWINSDIRATKITRDQVMECFEGVKTKEEGAEVQEGQYGGGAGMTCSQYVGGTGTASRLVGGIGGGKEHTVGVLVQTNFGHRPDLVIGGVPIGRILIKEAGGKVTGVPDRNANGGRTNDGSLLVVIFTDAPLLPHQLQRLARHATGGVAQVGSYGIGRTFSGDIFLAVSTAEHDIEQLQGEGYKIGKTTQTYSIEALKNESIDAYFVAVAEATEEAILNSMVASRDGIVGLNGSYLEGLPVDKIKELLAKYRARV